MTHYEIGDYFSILPPEETMKPLQNTALTELTCETVEPEGRQRCSECSDLGPGDKLFSYATKHGAKSRIHDGLFCSKACHDIFHGLARRTQ